MSDGREIRICEAFAALCDMAIALGEVPMNKHVGCWEHDVDARWQVAFNGHPQEHTDSQGFHVPPFHCAVRFNGWPAGLFSPEGGVVAAGDAANETTFIAALRKAEAAAKERAT